MSENKPDLMAELAEVPVVAYAWRKEGMVGWALGHKPPTPNMLDFDKYEVRELTFRTHHAELDAVRDARRLDWLESMANKPGGLLLHDGSESGRCGLGLRPGAADRDLRTAIDQAMHNSAREG